MTRGTVHGVPPGTDFVRALFDMMQALAKGHPAEFMARIQILVPSRRMQRRLKTLFEERGAHLLPRIGLVTDVSQFVPGAEHGKAASSLARLLDLKEVVARLVEVDQRLTESDVINLTLSLSQLLDEIESEGVSFDTIEALRPSEHSGHWDRSLGFLKAIRDYADALSETSRSHEAIHRDNVLRLREHWQTTPPGYPVIVAGSTGSRATTRLLMAAVADLSNGHVVLPGFDFDLPDGVWETLIMPPGLQDHAQYRFAAFLKEIGLDRRSVAVCGRAPHKERNRLVSLALRPAPVTDQWMLEGPLVGDLRTVTSDLSLIEARDAKQEATALAFAIIQELNAGKTVALIAPDATLARRVTAELSRWNVIPDDSGGMPLSLTPAGRFVRQCAQVAFGQLDPVTLIALLKHPLTHEDAGRGEHMRHTQNLELFLRKAAVVEVDAAVLKGFAADHDAAGWVAWLTDAVQGMISPDLSSLEAVHNHHMKALTHFAGPAGTDRVFAEDIGAQVQAILAQFATPGLAAARLTPREYSQLLDSMLNADSARKTVMARSDLMIWGTLEARVQGADVVILSGLNEGVWPEQPSADPWLNRQMRREVGLLLPERQIGLAAHDFQQAIGAPKVILSRANRVDGADTVPSRWLSRLVNLLDGLKANNGDVTLKTMRDRGNIALKMAIAADRFDGAPTPHGRPAPIPPIAARPRSFAVTDIQKLIRDPYAIYARKILKLTQLDPLVPKMDARRKGIVFHDILEEYLSPKAEFTDRAACFERLRIIATTFLDAEVSDIATRMAWWSQLADNADWLFESELKRRLEGDPLETETKGRYQVPGTVFMLTGKADRIDQLKDGRLVVYDYKTGGPPKKTEIVHFDRQLILEALMAENGAFEGVPPEDVAHVVHIGVGRTPEERVTELAGVNATSGLAERLATFLSVFLEPDKGFVSRRAMEAMRYSGDYDHLARYGEWDDASDSDPEWIDP
ncbi:MAG: double-strand break repair protein AddB [Pseudomonadota bacterium]